MCDKVAEIKCSSPTVDLPVDIDELTVGAFWVDQSHEIFKISFDSEEERIRVKPVKSIYTYEDVC